MDNNYKAADNKEPTDAQASCLLKDTRYIEEKLNTEDFPKGLHVEDLCEKLKMECDNLKIRNKQLQDEDAICEGLLSEVQSLIDKAKEDHRKKLYEMYTLECLKQSAILECHVKNDLELEIKKKNYTNQWASIKKQIEDITIQCQEFVDEIEHSSVMLSEKTQTLRDAYKVSEASLKACEQEKAVLNEEISWLDGEGIDYVMKRLMRSQDFYMRILPIIADAVHLGFKEGMMEKNNEPHMQVKVHNAKKKLKDAYTSFCDLVWPCLETLGHQPQDALQDIKAKICELTPEADPSKIWDDLVAKYSLGLQDLEAETYLQDQPIEDELLDLSMLSDPSSEG